MTDYKILGQDAPAAGVETNSYSVPSSNQALVRAINITNTSATADTIDIAITSASTGAITNADYIFKSQEVLGNETITVKGGYALDENNTIRVKSTNGTTAFNIFGGEI